MRRVSWLLQARVIQMEKIPGSTYASLTVWLLVYSEVINSDRLIFYSNAYSKILSIINN